MAGTAIRGAFGLGCWAGVGFLGFLVGTVDL